MIRMIFLLFALLPFDTFAFSCAAATEAGASLTITVIDSTTPCAAGEFTLLNSSEYASFLAASEIQIFDPVLAAAFWSFAMTFVVGCWLLAKHSGLIIAFIRRSIDWDK